MKALFLFLSITLLFSNLMGQSESLDQMDSKGKKHGKWTIFLDNSWKEIKDSTKAFYYRYTWYEHGTNIYPMGSFKKLTLNPADNSIKAGSPKLLDGQYKWLGNEKKVRFDLLYSKGEINSYKGFYSSGKIQEEFDYLGLWQGQPHTYRAHIYDKEGKVQIYYMRPGEYGWMLYGYKNADSVTNVTLKVIGDSTFFTGKMFKDGKIFQEYDEIRIKQSDGKVKEIRHGHVTSWYSNGQKKEEGDYYYGKKTGNWKWWDESGKLIMEEEYKNGNPLIKK